MELALLGCHPHRCERNCGVYIAQDKVNAVTINQLPGFCDANGDVICRIFDQELRLPAENAAAPINFLGCEASALDFRFCELRVDPGKRLDHTDFYGFFATGADQKGRRDLDGRRCQPGLE
jgi:hypothetical protein